MATKKPNYSFERHEREKLKAEKKAKRLAEKKEARNKNSEQPDVSNEIETEN